MDVTYNGKRVLVQMTIKRKPPYADIVPEVTLEAMQRVAETLRVRMADAIDRVEVRADDHRQGFYNFYVYPVKGRVISDPMARVIGERTRQVWLATGLPLK